MNKSLLAFWVLALFYCSSEAQSRDAAITANAELSAPTSNTQTGIGFSVKGSIGISRSGQITLSPGIWLAGGRNTPTAEHTRLVPVLLGYQQTFKSFFVEPAIGIGELGGRVSLGGDRANVSVAAFFAAVQAGYRMQHWQLGVKFLTAKGIEGSDAGLWHDRRISYGAVFVGFDIFRRKR